MATYTVKAGDSLSKIGSQYGVPYNQITGYKSGNPNLIYPGEVLNIPDKPGTAAPPTPAAPQVVPQQQAVVPQQQTTQAPKAQAIQQSQASGFNETYLRSKGYNDPNVIQNIMNNPSGYSIYNDYQRESGAVSDSGLGSFFKQPTIDLPSLYEGLFAKSGIKDVEAELSAKSRAYAEQVAKIKDNPYLSEATMTGRLSKLDEKFNADTKNIKDDIAMRKADIETQLNLQTKQFDITSEQATQAMTQFTSLLGAGALDAASGEDIANITRATGLSSTMIQSMIEYQKKKDAPKLELQTVDDGTNQYIVAIDSEGNVANKQIIGESKPVKSTGTSSTDKQAAADAKKQASFEKAISDGIAQLQKGISWGEVWNRIKALFPEAPNSLIDTLLGPDWKKPGAYQKYIANK